MSFDSQIGMTGTSSKLSLRMGQFLTENLLIIPKDITDAVLQYVHGTTDSDYEKDELKWGFDCCENCGLKGKNIIDWKQYLYHGKCCDDNSKSGSDYNHSETCFIMLFRIMKRRYLWFDIPHSTQNIKSVYCSIACMNEIHKKVCVELYQQFNAYEARSKVIESIQWISKINGIKHDDDPLDVDNIPDYAIYERLREYTWSSVSHSRVKSELIFGKYRDDVNFIRSMLRLPTMDNRR
jgi:hypothetical protein